MANNQSTNIVLVEGCRLPFQNSGAGYRNLHPYDLARLAIKSILDRSGIDPDHIDSVILGCTRPETADGNIARIAALGAGLPVSVTAFTLGMDCLSSHQAIACATEQIRSGKSEVVIAGGVDLFSGYALRHSGLLKRRRKTKPNTPGKKGLLSQMLDFRSGYKSGPDYNYESGILHDPGLRADRLAALLGITRESQDAYTVRSHQSAVKAARREPAEYGLTPASVPPGFDPVTNDNMIQHDCTPEKLAALVPEYSKLNGTVTSGNTSIAADGAAAMLIMTEKKAASLDLKPGIAIKDYIFTGNDPLNDLYPGPAYAIPLLLDQNKIKLEDIDVFEIHEGAAVDILAVIKTLASADFAKENFNKRKEVGKIPLKKLNPLGGSLAFGNPPGATGSRLIAMAADRLQKEKGKYALVASGTPDGLGHAMLLQSLSTSKGPE